MPQTKHQGALWVRLKPSTCLNVESWCTCHPHTGESLNDFQAAAKALAQLPEGASIDLALLHVSSIYGNAERLENVVPELRKVLPGLSAVVGCSSAGAIGMQGKGRVVEVSKGIWAVSLRKTLCSEEHR